jgi:small conductance mechanosensitive channel
MGYVPTNGSQPMDLDPQNLDPQAALLSVQTAFAQLSSLIVSYSFSVVGAIILLVAGYLLAGLAERSIRAALGRLPGFDTTLRQFFSKIVRYGILVLVIIMVLGQFGVQTASIVTAIGAVGLAIGLALQGTLQNIAAGIMLLVLRLFRVGEYVEVGPVAGTVEEIGLFATRLRAVDGVYLMAPNTTLWNQPVKNFTRNNARRNDVTVGVDYSDDLGLAQKTLVELAIKDKRVLEEPAPLAFVDSLGDSAVNITLRYWTAPSDFLAVKMDLTKAAKLAFDDKGLSIPFPQQVITYQDGSLKKTTTSSLAGPSGGVPPTPPP